MKIFHVTPDFPPHGRGIGYFVFYLSQELQRRGHEINVAFRGTQNREYVLENIKVIEIKCAGRPPLNTPLFRRYLERMLPTEKCDVIHVHHGAMPAIQCKIPIIVTAHWCNRHGIPAFYRPIRNLDSLLRNLLIPIYTRMERQLAHSCDRMTAVAASLAGEYNRYYGVTASVIFNAVDTEIFAPSATTSKEDSILFTGRLEFGKGTMDIVRIGQNLAISHPHVKVYIIGDGPVRTRLEGYIKKCGLRNIVLINHLSHTELVEFYRRSRLYVLPTYYEGFPTTILEAMACELPVVASDVSGIPDEIDQGVNGYMVRPGDVDGFYNRITELLDDQDKQKRFGKAGRKKVLENFTWKHVGDLVEAQYHEMLARN